MEKSIPRIAEKVTRQTDLSLILQETCWLVKNDSDMTFMLWTGRVVCGIIGIIQVLLAQDGVSFV